MDLVAAAVEAAETAARAARVRVRPVEGLAELGVLDRMLAGIWLADPSGPLLTTEMLRALAKSGNYVAGAYDTEGRAVGAAVGFFAAPAERELHSNIAGVVPRAAGHGVGFALKLHQRGWALHRDIATISWTYDPLVARNAHFNLVKLGAVPVEYLPDFYGAMHDQINGDDDSDRLLVHWDLAANAVVAAAAGKPRSCAVPRTATVALSRSAAGTPVAGPRHGPTVLVAVPPDVEVLRRRDPGAARQWRIAVRDTMTALLADGARFAGFDRDRGYVLTRG